MKSVKLKKGYYCRGNVESAFIDDTKLDFRNGIAVVKASVTVTFFGQESFNYDCMGVIDENYEEIYEGDFNSAGRNLMFMPENESMIRCGDNDFIVEVSCRNDKGKWTEFRHVKIVDGVPTLINKYLEGGCQKSSFENLVKIEESNEEDVFDVTALISLDGSYYVDYLFFKIDAKGLIVSEVLSSLENRFLDGSYTSIDDLLSRRKAQLIMLENSFSKMVNNLINSPATVKSSEEEGRSRFRHFE